MQDGPPDVLVAFAHGLPIDLISATAEAINGRFPNSTVNPTDVPGDDWAFAVTIHFNESEEHARG